jgi:ATP-dependent RNA helicase SUPV3L1/SUV3
VEDTCKLYSAYAWLSYRMPDAFPDGEAAVRHAREALEMIDCTLQQQNAAPKAAGSRRR